VPDEEFVKCPQRGKPELDRRATEIVPSEIPQIIPKIIALQLVPDNCKLGLWTLDFGLWTFKLMPADKFHQCLPVISLRVSRRSPIRRQMCEEFLNPPVADFNISFGLFHASF
jgi:hypothetical protein